MEAESEKNEDNNDIHDTIYGEGEENEVREVRQTGNCKTSIYCARDTTPNKRVATKSGNTAYHRPPHT